MGEQPDPLVLTVLGAGSALPAPGRGPAGYALHGGGLDGVTLLDCGPGSIRSLADRGLDLVDVRRVVVSHFHADHVLDLFHLAFARRNPNLDRDALPEVELVGPRGLAELVGVEPGSPGRLGPLGPLRPWIRDPRHRVVEVEPGDGRLELGDLALAHAAMRHSPEALAWRVEAPSGASLVYSGDTGETPALGELVARGGAADLLVAECGLPLDADPAVHLHGAACGRAARDGGARSLLLTHFYPDVDPEAARAAAAGVFDGPVSVAVDGTRVAVRPGEPCGPWEPPR